MPYDMGSAMCSDMKQPKPGRTDQSDVTNGRSIAAQRKWTSLIRHLSCVSTTPSLWQHLSNPRPWVNREMIHQAPTVFLGAHFACIHSRTIHFSLSSLDLKKQFSNRTQTKLHKRIWLHVIKSTMGQKIIHKSMLETFLAGTDENVPR